VCFLIRPTFKVVTWYNAALSRSADSVIVSVIKKSSVLSLWKNAGAYCSSVEYFDCFVPRKWNINSIFWSNLRDARGRLLRDLVERMKCCLRAERRIRRRWKRATKSPHYTVHAHYTGCDKNDPPKIFFAVVSAINRNFKAKFYWHIYSSCAHIAVRVIIIQ